MKFSLFLLLFCFDLHAGYFLPNVETKRTTDSPVIAKRSFFRSIDLFAKEFSELPVYFHEKLIVYKDWKLPHIDTALARRWEEAQILIYAGMAHRREIDLDALALIFCHELGHLYAGHPLKETGNYISAEGQADYFATKYCLRRALGLLDTENIEKRAHRAIKNVGKFLANNWGHPTPSHSTPDTSKSKTTITGYPSPQCRFDTYHAGLRGDSRPHCWFSPLDNE
jgi:hypothetical protein